MLNRIQQAHQSEVARIDGIGPKTAVRLKAALALAHMALQESSEERPILAAPDGAAALALYKW